LPVGAQPDFVRHGSQGFEQLTHLLRGAGIVERSHQINRLLQALQIGLELGFEGGVEHVRS